MTPTIIAALADGMTAITPNRRLARQLLRDFDHAQQAADRQTWPTPSVLPYATWLETMWEQNVDALFDADGMTLLTSAQSLFLWRNIVDAAQMLLLDAAGAARLAAEAWTLVHGWGAGGESWRAWGRDHDNADDPAVFATWAEAYSRELRRSTTLDAAQLPDLLASNAPQLDCGNLRVIFAGFIALTPQQRRLIAALTAAGADVRVDESPPHRTLSASRTQKANPREELIAALTWARDRALATPEARIGIVVENLAQRRDEALLLADEILCPELGFPYRLAARRPYEVSLGVPLSEVPLVLTALGMIALAEGPLPAGEAAALLRSPYLPDADTAGVGRAMIELDWLVSGRREATLSDVIATAQRRSPALSTLWRNARSELHKGPGASPREWVDSWRAWLSAAGWCGSLNLDSAEHQAREAWEKLLADFIRIGGVAPRLARADAVRMLRALAQDRVFQAEGGDAPIQLLGVLEGSGLTFDGLWVAGLSADRWPSAPAPNPLLPLHWQRERNVPRASAEGELAYARAVTWRFAIAAPEVVFSSAATTDDFPLAPSALLLDYPEFAVPATTAQTWTHAIAASAALDEIADDYAPALAAGTTVRGGARIVAAQSECPFQAVARHRLRAEPWPSPLAGLSRLERGILLHATMASLWNTLRDHRALAALDASQRAARIDAAVAEGLASLSAARWRMVPSVVRDGEVRRLASVLGAWLALDLDRPAFTVTGTEVAAVLELDAIRFGLRIDRVDALTDGGSVIIDYKSGQSDAPKQWFDERPRNSQLGMYALAQRGVQAHVPLRAVAYAQLKPDAIKAIGLAADPAAWPALTDLSRLERFGDWHAVENWWLVRLGALAREIASGWAAVVPRKNPSPCRACGLQALCRIDSVLLADDQEHSDD